MIVQGATPEFATDEVNKRHDWDGNSGEGAQATHPEISLPAVQQYCRADLSLQRDRAQYLVNTAEAITRSLSKSGDVEEGDARFVHAVVMTGLAKINQGDSSLSIREAVKLRAESLNFVLRNRLLKLQAGEASRRRSYTEAQRKLVQAKEKFVCVQTTELRRMVGKLANKKNLTPETFRKIQETYGILSQNVASATLGPGAEELQSLPAGNPADPGDANRAPEDFFHPPARVAQTLVSRMERFTTEKDEIAAAEELPGPDEQGDGSADL
jgi:hypothetical protein